MMHWLEEWARWWREFLSASDDWEPTPPPRTWVRRGWFDRSHVCIEPGTGKILAKVAHVCTRVGGWCYMLTAGGRGYSAEDYIDARHTCDLVGDGSADGRLDHDHNHNVVVDGLAIIGSPEFPILAGTRRLLRVLH